MVGMVAVVRTENLKIILERYLRYSYTFMCVYIYVFIFHLFGYGLIFPVLIVAGW